jgi:hypothetical protein
VPVQTKKIGQNLIFKAIDFFINIFFCINSFDFNIIWTKRFDLIRFFGISYLVRLSTKSSQNNRLCPIFVFCTGNKSSEKYGKKVEKKVFLTVYPGLKSEFLRPKTLKKTLFMHLRPVLPYSLHP